MSLAISFFYQQLLNSLVIINFRLVVWLHLYVKKKEKTSISAYYLNHYCSWVRSNLFWFFVYENLHSLKEIIRKRGFFVLSILVSALFTALVTRILWLTDVLSQLSIIMTILSVTLFQWLLYICVVALKKCFTLGEMTIVSKSTIILLYGTLEFTCITVSVWLIIPFLRLSVFFFFFFFNKLRPCF